MACVNRVAAMGCANLSGINANPAWRSMLLADIWGQVLLSWKHRSAGGSYGMAGSSFTQWRRAVNFTKACALAAVGAVAILSSAGSTVQATPLGSAQSGMTRAIVDVARGDIVEVKRRRGRRGMRGRRARPRFRGRGRYRGRRYRRGPKWYYWAPWIGAYLYYESYESCYRSCRRRGYSRGYCRDYCDW